MYDSLIWLPNLIKTEKTLTGKMGEEIKISLIEFLAGIMKIVVQ